MSLTDQAAQSPGTKALPWAKLVQLNLGMTLLGASLGLAFPFAADVLAWGPGPHGLSVIALLCAVPLVATGITLIASALGLKALSLDIFAQDRR